MPTPVDETIETELVTFITETSLSDIPEKAAEIAERAFVDTVGVTLAGSDESTGALTIELATELNGETTLIGHETNSSPLEATFANATAGHTLDFDDTALVATDGHPSVPMVAPLLAIGEHESATGRDLITAYVVGFETQAYLDAPISPSHYERGWHATSTLGTFGAAAAIASLLDLSPTATRNALNIAASMPAGLKRNFGSMTKPLHAGRAARSGVHAAQLAAAGCDADHNAISGDGGFFDLYSGDATPDLDARHDLGEQWMLLSKGVDIKKYACCYYTHAAIYGATTLLEDHNLDYKTIERVRVEGSQGAIDAVEHDDPETSTQAKFSMPYLVAYALVHGTIDLEAFEADALSDPTTEAVRERVTFTADDEREYGSYGATVVVETKSGSTYERTQERPPGTHEDPLTEAELREKFEMCASNVLSDDVISTVFEQLRSLRECDDISAITETL